MAECSLSTGIMVDLCFLARFIIKSPATMSASLLAKPIDFQLVPWLLVGMLMAALLSWLLAWAKTFALASVSEQISIAVWRTMGSRNSDAAGM